MYQYEIKKLSDEKFDEIYNISSLSSNKEVINFGNYLYNDAIFTYITASFYITNSTATDNTF